MNDLIHRDADATRQEGEDRPVGVGAVVVDQVIPRLVENCRRAQASRTISAAHVETLARLAIGRDGEAADCHVRALIEGGVNAHQAITELIGPAAHRLGDYWNCDAADFSEVAIGAARLVRIARRLGLEAERRTPIDAPRALIATPGAERHGIGALVVAQVFRTAGWRVTGLPGADADEIVAEAAAGGYHLVGLSVSSDRATSDLAALIARLRRATDAAIALGGQSFVHAPELATGLGADFVATDAQEALEKTRLHLSQADCGRMN
jgi:methylmalonyl-CoA mutase cobalamin-binding subunit